MKDIDSDENKNEDIKKEAMIKTKENSFENKEEKKDFKELKNNDNIEKESNEEPPIQRIKSAISNKNIENKKVKCLQIESKISKTKTFNKDRRTDRFGNIIIHGGKQKVTFIDRVTKNNFTEVVKVENYKEYNKMEETNDNHGNGCCILL